MEAKGKRGANFTKAEVDLLIDISLKFKEIIENKQTDSTTWKDKNEAWERICEEFNASSGNFPRSIKTIRAKYDSIKKEIRKKCSFFTKEQKKTGGGPCPGMLSEHEAKILEVTRKTMLGFSSRFDGDADDDTAGTSDFEATMTQEDLDEEKSTQGRKRKITDYTSVDVNEKLIGKKKFIFKKKRAKPVAESSRMMKENLDLKNELLKLQRSFLLQEIESRSEINRLTVENLKMDAQIKMLTIKRLETNIVDDY